MSKLQASHGDEARAGTRSKVLLVDDDDAVRRNYERLLRALGCDVVTAVDGVDAIEQLAAGSVELIVSDIGMPRLSGLAFLRAVREHDLDVPIVLMTGAPALDTAMEAIEYGAFRYLVKPVPLDTMRQVVRQAVHMHALARLKREALTLVGADGKQLGDRASLDARFMRALDQLWMAFQPIVRWPARSVFAYEALMRSEEPSLRSPLDLLDAAERLGRLHDLGRRVRGLVADAARAAPPDALLFVNLHAADLNDAELLALSSPLTEFAPRVVLELTERASLEGVSEVPRRVAALRALGFRIAIDDLGAGYAGLSSFAQLDPDFVKLDMSLVRGIDVSARKRSVVRAMSRLCTNELAIDVISEGVETVSERDALVEEGCSVLQGYLFARPGAGFPTPSW